MSNHLAVLEVLGEVIVAYKARIAELEQINAALQQTIQRLQAPATEATDSDVAM